MDELEKRLKADAREIRVEVSPELEARLAASLHSATPAPEVARTPSWSLWLASSLTGLAAAMLLIVLINWNREPAPPVAAPATVSTTPPVESVLQLPPAFSLNARTAVLTEPLEDELENIQADLEKARQTVARDIASTF